MYSFNKELYGDFGAIALVVARWFALEALGVEVGDDGVRLGSRHADDAGRGSTSAAKRFRDIKKTGMRG